MPKHKRPEINIQCITQICVRDIALGNPPLEEMIAKIHPGIEAMEFQ